jgi:hypothetical protein
MNVTQVASVAAAFEAARMAGIQQAGSSAATVTVQRETNRSRAGDRGKDRDDRLDRPSREYHRLRLLPASP